MFSWEPWKSKSPEPKPSLVKFPFLFRGWHWEGGQREKLISISCPRPKSSPDSLIHKIKESRNLSRSHARPAPVQKRKIYFIFMPSPLHTYVCTYLIHIVLDMIWASSLECFKSRRKEGTDSWAQKDISSALGTRVCNLVEVQDKRFRAHTTKICTYVMSPSALTPPLP